MRALALLGVMFLWQFPHFMAIAWLYRDDYARAGQQMLTVVDPTGLAGRRAGGGRGAGVGAGQPGAGHVAASRQPDHLLLLGAGARRRCRLRPPCCF